MTRAEVEHVRRAAAAITGEEVFVLLGSQAALIQHAGLPAAMTVSDEIDLYPEGRPDLADVIDGAIGRDLPFHATFGYYADGVGPETALLPRGWRGRAVSLRTPAMKGAVAVAPAIHDLVAAKLLAGRDKDWNWYSAAAEAGLIDRGTLVARLRDTDAGVASVERAVSIVEGKQAAP